MRLCTQKREFHFETRFIQRLLYRASVLAALGIPLTESAASVPIYGGPAYDSTTQTGYADPDLTIGAVVDGVTVGGVSKYEAGVYKGDRAVRWDVSGAAATELGNIGTDSNGVAYCGAYAFNNAGTVVGFASTYVLGVPKGKRAVRWDASGTAATELGNIGTDIRGYTSSEAWAINAAGTAVGFAAKSLGDGGSKGDRAVRWEASGTAATELGNLGIDGSSGVSNSYAYAINTAGTAVGFAEKYVSGISNGTRAVRWDASGTAATELGNPGVDGNSRAYAINTAGTAVGYARLYVSGIDKGAPAVRWDASGATTELGNLGTDFWGATYGGATAINTAGTAVGSIAKYVSYDYLGDRATRWDASGTVATELGNLGADKDGIAYSQPYAINSAGIAVGNAEKWDSSHRPLGIPAVAWGLDGVAIDLNTLIDPSSGWVFLDDAGGISDTNWVSGVGWFDPGNGQEIYRRAFLLNISSAVPEPSGLSILALTLPALFRRRRRGVVQGGVVSSSRASNGTKQDASSATDPCASRQAGDDAFQSPHLSLVAAVLLLVLSPAAQAAVPPDLFVASYFYTTLSRFDGTSGALVYDRDVGYNIIDVAFGPDGNAYASTLLDSTVERIDPSTGALMGTFASGDGLDVASGLAFGPDSNLYVVSRNTNDIRRFNGVSGAFSGVFASGGGLAAPEDVAFGPDGNLYVTEFNGNRVLKYDGTSGAFIGVFAMDASLDGTRQMAFGPDGNLYVSGNYSNNVLRFDGVSGASLGVFASKIPGPNGLAFDSDGNLYVAAEFGNLILRLNGTSGAIIDIFADVDGPIGIAFPVPEPTGLGLIVVVGVLLARRRRNSPSHCFAGASA